MLQDNGVPMPVERTIICPPRCRMGAITTEERATVRSRSPIGVTYDTRLNRESACEILASVACRSTRRWRGRARHRHRSQLRPRPGAPRQDQTRPKDKSDLGTQVSDILWGTKRRQGMVEAMAKQAARAVGSQIGRQILRGVLGGILGGSRR
jgi:hypothetical protein